MSRVPSCAIDAAVTTAFRDDGVVLLPGALAPDTLALARSAYDWSLDNPGPGASKLPSKGSGTFYQDLANPGALAHYRPLVVETEIAELVAGLFGGADVWFMYEQGSAASGASSCQRRAACWASSRFSA